MTCSFCGNEMYIVGSKIHVDGDRSPDTETVVVRALKYQCRNPRCDHRSETRDKAIRLY